MCKICDGFKYIEKLNPNTEATPYVSLGRGTLYISKMKDEIKEASVIWGFPCIYYIGNKSEPMEYQFIQFCPICGEKLV